MKLVVGLGNPGQKYKNTRHNVGFMVVDRLKKEYGEKEAMFIKPDQFMNKSGVVLKRVVKNFPGALEKDLVVIHDDLDIKLGEHKIGEKGPREHNGLKNIYEQIGISNFKHVRIGIDNGEFRESGEDYVLSKWRSEEREIINGVIEKVVKELKHVLVR